MLPLVQLVIWLSKRENRMQTDNSIKRANMHVFSPATGIDSKSSECAYLRHVRRPHVCIHGELMFVYIVNTRVFTEEAGRAEDTLHTQISHVRAHGTHMCIHSGKRRKGSTHLCVQEGHLRICSETHARTPRTYMQLHCEKAPQHTLRKQEHAQTCIGTKGTCVFAQKACVQAHDIHACTLGRHMDIHAENMHVRTPGKQESADDTAAYTCAQHPCSNLSLSSCSPAVLSSSPNSRELCVTPVLESVCRDRTGAHAGCC